MIWLQVCLLISILSISFGQSDKKAPQRSTRTPEYRGQIKYNDPDGSEMNVESYAAYHQWRSDLENSPHSQSRRQSQPQQRGQSHLIRPQEPQLGELDGNQLSYKPYSELPNDIRQLIYQTYQPQRPFVDPSAFIYTPNSPAMPQQQDHQLSQATSVRTGTRYEPPRFQTIEGNPRSDTNDKSGQVLGVRYVNDEQDQQPVQEEQESPQYQPQYMLPKLQFDKNMPTEIQQLLQYQAQIPYDVIANRIYYKPKSVFVPQPIPEDVKGPYNYRSQIIFVDGNGEAEAEYQTKSENNQAQRRI